MVANKLKLNCDKTVVVLFKPKSQNPVHQPKSLLVGDEVVEISDHFTSLGVVFDSHMKMERQVNMVTKSMYFQLRRISSIRRQLNRAVTETLVNTLITSRLDYCNSLLCFLPKTVTRKLQVAQNSAAKTIMFAKKRDHATPLLKELHWLPVHFRSEFKVLILAFKAFHGSAPDDVKNLLSEYVPPRNLRSVNQRLLTHPSVPKKNFGARAFLNCAVSLWNGLPLSIRKAETLSDFKAKLKTHYFVLHFGSN